MPRVVSKLMSQTTPRLWHLSIDNPLQEKLAKNQSPLTRPNTPPVIVHKNDLIAGSFERLARHDVIAEPACKKRVDLNRPCNTA